MPRSPVLTNLQMNLPSILVQQLMHHLLTGLGKLNNTRVVQTQDNYLRLDHLLQVN